MCDCIHKTEERLLAHLKEKYPEREITVDSDDGLQNQAFTFSDGGKTKLYIDFFSHYTFEKKDGSRSVTKKDSVKMFFSFCPFCGQPYAEQKSTWFKSFNCGDNVVVLTHESKDDDDTPYAITQRTDLAGVKAEISFMFGTEEARDEAFTNYGQEQADVFYKNIKDALEYHRKALQGASCVYSHG